MKKKIFIIFIILALLITIGTIYLNQVVLPIKIKSLIIGILQAQTHKKASLESLRFNIFKGLILENLTLYDGTKAVISLKEGSCTFLVWPFFKKQIIIPTVRLKSVVIFLERKADNTFNLTDLFPKEDKAGKAKKRFSLFVYKINVTNGRIDFQDETLAPAFTKTIDNLNLALSLSLPASVKFKLKSEIPSNPNTKISAQGEFRIPQQQIAAKIDIQGLSPQEFFGYYQNFGISILQGSLDASCKLNSKGNILYADLDMQSHDMVLAKDRVTGKLNSGIKLSFQYNLKDKKFNYSGNADILGANISGLEFVDKVEDIKGIVKFDNSGLSCSKLSADCFGIPLEAAVSLVNFKDPLLNMNIVSKLDLNFAQAILKEKFQFSLPADIQGEGKLSLAMQAKIPLRSRPQINGFLDIANASLKAEKLASVFENINGRLEFSLTQLEWSALNFKYLSTPYKTSGTLTDFTAPKAAIELSSQDLSLESILAVDGKLIRLSKCAGRYLNSEFSLTGNIDTTDPSKLGADISAELDIDLKDTKALFKEFKEQLEKIAPGGMVHAQLSLAGNINDLKSCAVKAHLTSPAVSIYGLKSDGFLMDYNQADRLINIPVIHLSLYDGALDASAKMNLSSQNLPYWVELNLQGVKLEKLKLDTAAGDKDISGTIQAQAKLNGFSGDLSKLSGAGEIFVTDGNLWQLNLFKGLGGLLFTKDFTSIIFSQGYCGFSIQDKSIFSDNLKLASNLVNLTGSVKIGFDSSIGASLNVQVLDDAPLTGTLKDVTTAIMGEVGRFGTIKITGTLKDPKYKFKAAVVDIIKGLKDIFLKK